MPMPSALSLAVQFSGYLLFKIFKRICHSFRAIQVHIVHFTKQVAGISSNTLCIIMIKQNLKLLSIVWSVY